VLGKGWGRDADHADPVFFSSVNHFALARQSSQRRSLVFRSAAIIIFNRKLNIYKKQLLGPIFEAIFGRDEFEVDVIGCPNLIKGTVARFVQLLSSANDDETSSCDS
jgi:hypothetical protein